MPRRPTRVPAVLAADHVDFVLLSEIAEAILRQAGGIEGLRAKVPPLIRQCIDGVINTPDTGRRTISELQNSAKTYIGTQIEIALRKALKIPRSSKLDVVLAGRDVDVKSSLFGRWMIPPQAIG